MADLRTTAINPNAPIRRDQLPQMTATPRSPRLGMLADALMAARNFANRVQVPQAVPLIGGEGLGSLVLGRAPEELVEMSYGNMPMRVNPYAGRTASFVPEMKPNRGAQVADLLSLAGVPGGGRTAAGLMSGAVADLGGVERALIGYHGTPHRFAPTPANPLGEFRASQIGTGEGAQAYGYGTYFAEAPGVAKGYKTALSSPSLSVQGREIVPTPGSATDVAKAWLEDVYGRGFFNSATSNPFDQAIRDVQNAPVPNKQDVILELQRLKESGATMTPGGSLYTVDIPDEMIGKMLDWDKPLNKQEPEVQRALANAWAKEAGVSFDDAMQQLKSETQTAESWYRNESFVRGGSTPGTLVESSAPRNPAAVSEFLRQAGIPGIKYFDEQSRNIADDALWGLNKMRNKVAKAEVDYKANPSEALADRLESARQELRSAERGVSDLTRNIVVFPGEEQNVKILSRD